MGAIQARSGRDRVEIDTKSCDDKPSIKLIRSISLASLFTEVNVVHAFLKLMRSR